MKEWMTSRQRVMNALEHKPVDRFPIDLGVHWSSGISAFAYQNLRRYLGLEADVVDVPEPNQLLAKVDEDIIKRFHIDTMVLHPGFKHTAIWNPRGNYKFRIPKDLNPVLQEDGGYLATNGEPGVGLKMPKGGFFFDGVGFDYSGEPEDEMMKRYAERADYIYNETDYFTMFVGYDAYFTGDVMFTCELLTDPDGAREKIKALHEYNKKHFLKLVKYCGNHIQSVSLGGDLGTQNGPMMDPDLYEEEYFPYIADFVKFIKENSDYKVFLHSCGSVRKFIPYFIEEGIDALNPVQISANEMDPSELKKEFGDKIAFWGGGCNTQKILNMGTVEDVKENTKMLCNVFKKNSGFVFNQVHNIMGDIAPEKIVAMFDTAYENSFWEED